MKASTTNILILKALYSEVKGDDWTRGEEREFYKELSSDDMKNIEEITKSHSEGLELESSCETYSVWDTEVVKLKDFNQDDFSIEEVSGTIQHIKDAKESMAARK
jgi:hypothetical protein